jgi:repressor LexA
MGKTPPGQTREKVFRFVQEKLLEGRPPTMAEIRDHLGFRSAQTAREHLERLARDGRLEKMPGARGYRVVGGSASAAPVPIVGRVVAGGLSFAAEDIDGYEAVEGGHGLFGLRVHGQSMRDAGILDGDLVLVRPQATARTGDIVVALVGDEATVKMLHRSGKRVELRPKNPAFRPIVPKELHILGKVVEVRRRLT